MPSVRTHDAKLDLLDMLKLVSPGVAQDTLSKRFTAHKKALKAAHALAIQHISQPMNILHLSDDREVALVCARLGAKEAAKLMSAVNLLRLMPPSHVAWVVWDNDRTSTRMLVTSTFAKAFISEFVHTADAYKLKADLVQQHSLNDGAPASHVAGLAQRGPAMAGLEAQRVALSGTGVAPDPEPTSEVRVLAGVPFDPSKLTQVENMQLSAMIRKEERLEAEHELRMQQAETEHKARMALTNEQRTLNQEQRTQGQAKTQALLTHNSMQIEGQQKDSIRKQLETCTDDNERAVLGRKLDFFDNPTPRESFAVATRGVQAPQPLVQAGLAKGGGSLVEIVLPPNCTVVHAEMAVQRTVNEYVAAFHPYAKLSPQDEAKLGALVAKEFEARMKHALPLRAHLLEVNERFGRRCYPVSGLATPPLSKVIAKFVEDHGSAPPESAQKRRERQRDDKHVHAAKKAKLTPITAWTQRPQA